VHDFLTVGAAAPLQEAAVTGLRFGDDYYEWLRQKYTDKRDLFLAGLDDIGIVHTVPQGAYYVMLDISEFGYKDGVAGGNFFILAKDVMAGVKAAQLAVKAISHVPGTITPFPGGMVASGSKVGSNKYSKFLNASTNEKMCVTLKDQVDSDIRPDADGVSAAGT